MNGSYLAIANYMYLHNTLIANKLYHLLGWDEYKRLISGVGMFLGLEEPRPIATNTYINILQGHS